MKNILYLDRGAVLFVGIFVGAVLALSFLPNAEPFARLMPVDPNITPMRMAPTAKTCGVNFPFSQRVVHELRANQPLRIGVFGDSFGDGLWAASIQNFRSNHSFVVYRFSQEGTGFTRYQSHDLLKDAKAKLALQPIDIALIDVGANDTQGLWINGKGATYMSPAWRKEIGTRAGALISYFRDQGVAVAWLGLPRMRKKSYDDDVQAMNGFFAQLTCSLGVPFIDPVIASEDGQQQFAIELADPTTKKPYTARAEDGIHMSMHGYRVIAQPLFERINVLSGDPNNLAVKGS